MEHKRLPVLARVKRRELCLGLCLVGLGFFMPLFFTVANFNILGTLYSALTSRREIGLMYAALKLVTLNSLRALPHYVGVFLIAESLEFRIGERICWWINALLVVLALQLTYWGIEAIHGVHYDFGLPALLMMAMLLLFYKLNYQYISIVKKLLLLSGLLVACQFLDIMPAARDLPFGRGEISMDIKLAGAVMHAEGMLNILSFSGFLLFFMFGLLLLVLLRDENNLRQLNALKEQNQIIRTQAMIHEMEKRTYQEMRALVHDLKSPLTAVQTLVGVIRMESEMEQDRRYIDYLNHIETAIDQMDRMISELLYEGKTTPERVQLLVDLALAQISVEPYAACLETDIQSPQAVVQVNQLLFSRALVNLIHNSARSIPADQEPHILLRVEAKACVVRFTVEDNGCGIPEDRKQDVWTPGYSGTQSSGLGLPFVRNVVERMGGSIEMESTVGKGTAISLCLPEEEEENSDEP